jgi:hypothetical protein
MSMDVDAQIAQLQGRGLTQDQMWGGLEVGANRVSRGGHRPENLSKVDRFPLKKSLKITSKTHMSLSLKEVDRYPLKS